MAAAAPPTADVQAESGAGLTSAHGLTRTQLRREQRRVYVMGLRRRLGLPVSELQARLRIAEPVVAAGLAGARPSTIARQRRNVAMHHFDIPAATISAASGPALNALQRSRARDRSLRGSHSSPAPDGLGAGEGPPPSTPPSLAASEAALDVRIADFAARLEALAGIGGCVAATEAELLDLRALVVDQAAQQSSMRQRWDESRATLATETAAREEQFSSLRDVVATTAGELAQAVDSRAEVEQRLADVENALQRSVARHEQAEADRTGMASDLSAWQQLNARDMMRRLDAAEAKLDDELSREASGRAADTSELKELIGRVTLAQEAHHLSVQDLLATERSAQESRLSAIEARLPANDSLAIPAAPNVAEHVASIEARLDSQRPIEEHRSPSPVAAGLRTGLHSPRAGRPPSRPLHDDLPGEPGERLGHVQPCASADATREPCDLVKDVQRSGPRGHAQWTAFCAAWGYNCHDPLRYSPHVLRMFLAQHDRALQPAPSPAGEAAAGDSQEPPASSFAQGAEQPVSRRALRRPRVLRPAASDPTPAARDWGDSRPPPTGTRTCGARGRTPSSLASGVLTCGARGRLPRPPDL